MTPAERDTYKYLEAVKGDGDPPLGNPMKEKEKGTRQPPLKAAADVWADLPEDQPEERLEFWRLSALADGDTALVEFTEEPHAAVVSQHAKWEAACRVDGALLLFAPSSPYLAGAFKQHRPLKGKKFNVTVRGEGFDRRYTVERA